MSLCEAAVHLKRCRPLQHAAVPRETNVEVQLQDGTARILTSVPGWDRGTDEWGIPMRTSQFHRDLAFNLEFNSTIGLSIGLRTLPGVSEGVRLPATEQASKHHPDFRGQSHRPAGRPDWTIA